MQVGIRSEHDEREARVALTPATVASVIDLGCGVVVEHGAGEGAGFPDSAYEDAGATLVTHLDRMDVLLSVGALPQEPPVKPGGIAIGLVDPSANDALLTRLTAEGTSVVAMEAIPRSTLAQSMDALSSQATAAGYAAVLLGTTSLHKFMPMLVTAAGTMPPAKVLVLGVGVAGLQAIATARRLGAVVSAYDIRPETREQVESLGAKFVDAPTQEMDEGGYARAVDEDTAERQREILADAVADSDLLVTTAQVPGRAAPRLVEAATVARMRPGSVIVDMAAGSGGNVEGSVADTEVDVNGVRILGPTNLASKVAADASRMYARNLLEVLKRVIVDGELSVDPDDPVIGPALVAPRPDDEGDSDE